MGWESFWAAFEQALGAMEAKEWDNAIGTLERLLEMDADYPNAVSLLERAQVEQKASEQAQRIVTLV